MHDGLVAWADVYEVLIAMMNACSRREVHIESVAVNQCDIVRQESVYEDRQKSQMERQGYVQYDSN